MLPRIDLKRRWALPPVADGAEGASRERAAGRSLPEQLRPRWRRACVQHPEATAFAEDCLDIWYSHLRGRIECDDSCGDDSCGGGDGGRGGDGGGPTDDGSRVD